MKKLILFLLFLSFTSVSLFSQTILAEGKWETIDYSVKGKWQIVQKTDGNYVILDKDFKTRSGPDLHLLFSTKKISQLSNSNATPSSVIIGELKRSRGAQEFKIKNSINWENYNTIIIHCVTYSHLWAGSNLK